jgi:hypothetical protein
MKRLGAVATIIAAAVVVSACSGTAGVDEKTGDQSSAIQIGTPSFYDYGTQCTVGGTTMHCCPFNTVMVGARVDQNVFKCAWLTHNDANGAIVLDTGTQCEGMHCCPTGSMMVGLRADKNQLACQYVNGELPTDYLDGNPPTEDAFPMHVCPGWTGTGPSTFAMAGIRIDKNEFTCRQ